MVWILDLDIVWFMCVGNKAISLSGQGNRLAIVRWLARENVRLKSPFLSTYF